MMGSNGPISVPPGFRFHPTEEELLYYYLKKKVSYEAIDLDVIREVDLNKLEPWDLKERCRIGTGAQEEWYLFSHKDKKYPTGTRTNRATGVGFWKATGRDKPIYHANANANANANRIGMRKTLVFYTGRAPHGQKTDWIMHEYRLQDHNSSQFKQEEGWVVCRVFKKSHGRGGSTGGGLHAELQQDDEYNTSNPDHHVMKSSQESANPPPPTLAFKQANYSHPLLFPPNNNNYNYTYDGTMHLPHLSSPEALTTMHMESLLRLSTAVGGGGGGVGMLNAPANGAEWGFLDKLLTNYQSLEASPPHNKGVGVGVGVVVGNDIGSSSSQVNHHKFSFQYLATSHPSHLF